MTAFLSNVTSHSRPSSSVIRAVLAGISAFLAARRERARLKAEIKHLQELPTHLLRDAGIDHGPLFSAVARIAEVHESVLFGIAPRRNTNIAKRPHSW